MADGQGDNTPTTPTTDGQVANLTAQLQDLQKQLGEANTTITRLRGTQSVNDRTIGEQKSEIEKLVGTTTDMEAQLKAFNTDKAAASKTITDLQGRLTNSEALQSELEALKTNQNRLLIAAGKAGNPIIAALITNNALPQADTDEAFGQALENIISGSNQAVQIQVQNTLQGTKPAPNVQGSGSETPEEKIRRGENLMRQKKTAEGIALIQEGQRERMANPS
jgi:chromosome segregation ATPase